MVTLKRKTNLTRQRGAFSIQGLLPKPQGTMGQWTTPLRLN